MKYKFKDYKKTELIKNHLNLGGSNPKGERIDVTNLYFTLDEKPWIAVMGEFHFSRYDRKYWYEELCKMKAGGITVVSTYLFWIYHEEIEGEFDFSGDNDIRLFIKECERAGLYAVIRIGPWAHGECRNGGLPDWILNKPYKLRDNNPEYMEKTRIWYSKIYEQVKGLFYKDGGNIIAVQLENELVDNAQHLLELKKLAVNIGFEVPLYTVTGWNSAAGAKIPVDDVVPVFGGYAEAPWENHKNQLLPSPHYFFNRMRNDSAIGTDLIAKTGNDEWQLPYERYPFATCELGGGIQITHHRRPIIKGMDIYAVSLVKIGDGNNLVGYYMYHGGTNKIGKLSTFNESKATGYPNDYPILSYDFQAPVSEYGEIREQYRLLNILHLFVNDFGEMLAPMEAVDAEFEVKRDDTSSLRYGMRTDGTSGFVFINHYQRLYELKDIQNAVIDTGNVVFPKINICGEVSFFMPFNISIGESILEYATAQPVCCVGDTYFFSKINGIDVEYKFKNGEVFRPEAGLESVFCIDGVKIVTLGFEQAMYMRRLSDGLYIGNKCDLYECGGEICSVQDGNFEYYVWNGETFDKYSKEKPFKQAELFVTELCEAPFEPKYKEELSIGGERNISWKKLSVNGDMGFVEIDYYGDAAQIYADGELIADDYYYGKKWRVPAHILYNKECYLAVSEMYDDFYREF